MNILNFEFEANPVRVIADENGDLLFVAKDLVHAVDAIWKGTDSVAHVPEEWRVVRSVWTIQGEKNVVALTEQGMYFYLIRSDKPKALPLQKKVAGEILPSIRKTGSYSAVPRTLPEALRLAADEAERAERAEAQLAIAAPKVEVYERISVADNSLTITEVAKVLKVKPSELFDFLRCNKWVYRRPGAEHDLAFQDKINAGFLVHVLIPIPSRDGSQRARDQVRVMPKGVTRLAEIVPGWVGENRRFAA